jgi:hypothetical protein
MFKLSQLELPPSLQCQCTSKTKADTFPNKNQLKVQSGDRTVVVIWTERIDYKELLSKYKVVK